MWEEGRRGMDKGRAAVLQLNLRYHMEWGLRLIQLVFEIATRDKLNNCIEGSLFNRGS